MGDIAKDVERVYGKERLLVDIATASIDDPGGRICDVIFPVVGKEKLAAIIKESNAKGALDRRIYAVMRNFMGQSLSPDATKPAFRSRVPVEQCGLATGSVRTRLDHGQSAVGFAFCRLLGFELAPRLKAIARQKLALPDAGFRTNLSNLLPILSNPINWEEIEHAGKSMKV